MGGSQVWVGNVQWVGVQICDGGTVVVLVGVAGGVACLVGGRSRVGPSTDLVLASGSSARGASGGSVDNRCSVMMVWQFWWGWGTKIRPVGPPRGRPLGRQCDCLFENRENETVAKNDNCLKIAKMKQLPKKTTTVQDSTK